MRGKANESEPGDINAAQLEELRMTILVTYFHRHDGDGEGMAAWEKVANKCTSAAGITVELLSAWAEDTLKKRGFKYHCPNLACPICAMRGDSA